MPLFPPEPPRRNKTAWMAWFRQVATIRERRPGAWSVDFRSRIIEARPRSGGRVPTFVNGAWVYTYDGLSPEDAITAVIEVIKQIDGLHLTAVSHADHWYIGGRAAYAAEELRLRPKFKCPPRPDVPPGLPQIGDVVEYADDGATPECEGPAVVLTVRQWARGVLAWDLHTRAGVLRAVRNTRCMTVIRRATMPDDVAAKVRRTVWTPKMREHYDITAFGVHDCACQGFPAGPVPATCSHCATGRHSKCVHNRRFPPRHETLLRGPDDSPVHDLTRPPGTGRAQFLYLADRDYRSWCQCGCQGGEPEADAAPVGELPGEPDLLEAVRTPSRWATMRGRRPAPEGQGDLFSLI